MEDKTEIKVDLDRVSELEALVKVQNGENRGYLDILSAYITSLAQLHCQPNKFKRRKNRLKANNTPKVVLDPNTIYSIEIEATDKTNLIILIDSEGNLVSKVEVAN